MMWHLVTGLGGVIVGILIGVWVDKDTVYRIARIKVKGRGHTITDLLDVDPDALTDREVKKIERMKKRLKR